MSMNSMEQGLRAFHSKYGFPVDLGVSNDIHLSRSADPVLTHLAARLHEEAKNLKEVALAYQARYEERTYRAHLMVEELAELLEAMGNRDEVLTADAVTDLLYVVLGTAVTYGIPVQECFDEVQRSNMSKERPADDRRMAKKGPNYSPPRLAEAIQRGREVRA